MLQRGCVSNLTLTDALGCVVRSYASVFVPLLPISSVNLRCTFPGFKAAAGAGGASCSGLHATRASIGMKGQAQGQIGAAGFLRWMLHFVSLLRRIRTMVGSGFQSLDIIGKSDVSRVPPRRCNADSEFVAKPPRALFRDAGRFV